MNDTPFATVLRVTIAKLQAQHPEREGEIARANALITNGHVLPMGDGTARVLSSSDPALWYEVNGSCNCPDAVHRKVQCKHISAWKLYQFIEKQVAAQTAPPALASPEASSTASSAIPSAYLTKIQGRDFIRFEGLLALAHEAGLVELSTTIVHCDLNMAVCQAIVRFKDGRVFCDIGDASPDNVAKHLRPHFIRMAATRASARALRRALNISACSVEELSEHEVTHG
jgi:hypothetical protein